MIIQQVPIVKSNNPLYPTRAKLPPAPEVSKPNISETERTLKLIGGLKNTVEYHLFCSVESQSLFADELKQLQKDRKNYLDFKSKTLKKKLPAQLYASEKEFRLRIRANRKYQQDKEMRDLLAKAGTKRLKQQTSKKEKKEPQQDEIDAENVDLLQEFGQSRGQAGEEDNQWEQAEQSNQVDEGNDADDGDYM